MMAATADLRRDPIRVERSDGIDLLRAGLALWVLLTHLVAWCIAVQGAASVPGWLARFMILAGRLFQGSGELHPGVVAFIVLSGYCIHRAGLREPGSGQLAGYAIRRFFRIMPIFYLATAAGLLGVTVAGWRSVPLAAALSGTSQIDLHCLAAKLMFLPALSPRLHQCSFVGNAPLATVVVEVVLYALYAAAFAGLVWRGRSAAIWLLCGGLTLAMLGMLGGGVSPEFYGWWQNGSVFGFLPYWWLGVAFVNPLFAAFWVPRVWLVVGLWLALSAVLLLASPPALLAVAEIRKLAFAVGFGVLIVAIDRQVWRGLWLAVPIGRAGYGLYALHAPLTYTLVIYGLPWWSVLLANLMLSLVVHHLIERPLARYGRMLRQRIEARPLAVSAKGAM